PQYVWSRNAARLVRATSSRQATRRGHAKHSEIAASSSVRSSATGARWAGVIRLPMAARDVVGQGPFRVANHDPVEGVHAGQRAAGTPPPRGVPGAANAG